MYTVSRMDETKIRAYARNQLGIFAVAFTEVKCRDAGDPPCRKYLAYLYNLDCQLPQYRDNMGISDRFQGEYTVDASIAAAPTTFEYVKKCVSDVDIYEDISGFDTNDSYDTLFNYIDMYSGLNFKDIEGLKRAIKTVQRLSNQYAPLTNLFGSHFMERVYRFIDEVNHELEECLEVDDVLALICVDVDAIGAADLAARNVNWDDIERRYTINNDNAAFYFPLGQAKRKEV